MRSGKLVYGVGINDADYVTQEFDRVNGKNKLVWRCPFYHKWKSMLERCYSEKWHIKQPTYRDCSVCDEWLIFSNFKMWMQKQDWEGKHLDKDLLKEGNKIYCPEWCIFVDQNLNKFVTDHYNARGQYMIGVYWHKQARKFKAQCWNPFRRRQEHLGVFQDEMEGHLAWKARKHELACMLAESEYCNDPRLAEALRTRYL